MSADLAVRKEQELADAFGSAYNFLQKSYLNTIRDSTVVSSGCSTHYDSRYEEELRNTVRFMDITKIVLDKSENQRDKLVSIYRAIAESGYSLLLMIQGTKTNMRIKVGLRSDRKSPKREILEKLLKGNFSGTEIRHIDRDFFKAEIYECLTNKPYLSVVSGIAGLRAEKESETRQFVQGYEKLLDTLQGDEFTLLLIADPVSGDDLAASRQALESMYTRLVPYSSSEATFGITESQNFSRSMTESVTTTISRSISDSISHTVGASSTVTDGSTKGSNISVECRFITLGGNSSSSHAEAKSFNSADTRGQTLQSGRSEAEGKAITLNTSAQKGTNQSVQLKFEDHSVTQFLKRIDEELKRYDECADLGMWNCAMYCLSATPDVARLAASAYQALMRGKHSSLETGCITTFDTAKIHQILPYLLRMKHPVFDVKGLPLDNKSGVTAGMLVSTAELAIHASLPNHSVPGIPVLECAAFGRNIATYAGEETEKFHLGKIFHMNHEEDLPVELASSSLASHVFVTGSTGAGKSNAVYQILHQARKKGKTFLVIEPAKGEYKHVFGAQADVYVYGTNPNLAPLLKLNPFSFDCVHILAHEHIDRLISIFNVCWPMYAAMPAVLKDAVEKSYIDAGWDLNNPFAQNRYDNRFFPTFADVARNVRAIIDSSEYDNDNKGAYKGSLLTRLTSLTNGINGLIFTNAEIGDRKLFDRNTIIDLSRIGSAETKSLIMGILVLKLQEYRMASGKMNAELSHITVLEEAHNLLKRSVGGASTESGGLQALSVEMVANAIAEMRTYGEGFIIADQAPGLLDMAAIRNTNTKIIMRLPDLEDRRLVGKAAGLNDDQITELAKLPRGVAAVYQNEWVQSVLCRVEKAEARDDAVFSFRAEQAGNDMAQRLNIATLLSRCEKRSREAALTELSDLDISGAAKARAMDMLENPSPGPQLTRMGPVISALFPKAYAATRHTCFVNQEKHSLWTNDIQAVLASEMGEEMYNTLDERVRLDLIQALVTQYEFNELHQPAKLEQWGEHFRHY